MLGAWKRLEIRQHCLPGEDATPSLAESLPGGAIGGTGIAAKIIGDEILTAVVGVGISTTHHNAGPKVLGGGWIGGGGSKHLFKVARSAGKSAVEHQPPTESAKTVKTIKSVKTVKTIKTVQSATLRAGDPITGSCAFARLAHRRITSFLPHAAGLPHGAA